MKTNSLLLLLIILLSTLSSIVTANESVEVPTFNLPYGQWRMISLPATPPDSSNTLDQIFGNDMGAGGDYGQNWVVYAYNAESNEYGKALALTDRLEKGRGYWVIQLIEKDKPVTLKMPENSSVTSHESIPLTASKDGTNQWNLAGNPFATSLNLSELRLTTNAPSCSNGSCNLDKAKDNNLLQNKVWIYDGTGFKERGMSDSLNPWEGFWVAALASSRGYSLALDLNNTRANGLFRVSDGRIIAPDGSDFIARGINIYNSTFYPNDSPTKSADAVDQIVELFPKINMIRIAYQDDGPNNLFWSSTAVDDALLASFVEAATSRRIVVLLEDHSTIGNFTWTQGQIDAYTTFAARYKDNPYVWFGTENEPDSTDREGIVQNVRATYDAIRSTGNNNIICILSRGGGYTEDIMTYANYIQGGSVPNYPGSGPGAGGSSVTAMGNVIWDMHFYMWANPSASVEEVESALWDGIDSQWGPVFGINVYRNGPQSADGIIPVIVGEWGRDWAGDNVQAVILKTGPAPYPVGNLAWNWRAGDPDILVSDNNTRTPYGDAVNAFIDAGTGVPKPTSGINVTVDWNNVIREIPADAYGVNSPANFIPAYSNNPAFMSNLESITQKKGFIRLHGWGMLGDSPEAWQDNGVWDSTKIEQALRPLVNEGYTVMINVPSGPQGEDDYQDPAVFAKFCADLVKIVNIDHGLGIKYWEIPNERESGFSDPGLSVSEMATLITTASAAMKAVDPSIKVGGPATAWVNIDYLTQLVDEVYPNIDFITAHTYSGDGSNSLQNAYDIAQWAAADLAELRSRVNVITGDNYLPIFLTEYNISFQGSPRIQTYEGAVYDAIILTESITAGADASMFWAMAPYSDMSLLNGDVREKSSYLYEIFNQSFYGNLVSSQAQEPTKVIPYAVSNQIGTGIHAFSLINRTANPQAINLTSNNWQPTDMTWHLWDANNDFTTRNTSWTDLNNGDFILSPYSVNLFIEQP